MNQSPPELTKIQPQKFFIQQEIKKKSTKKRKRNFLIPFIAACKSCDRKDVKE